MLGQHAMTSNLSIAMAGAPILQKRLPISLENLFHTTSSITRINQQGSHFLRENTVNRLILSSCYDDATCIDRVKSIQRSHQIGNGWDDIGYHFLVGENGKVYEGRGWDRQGAHSPGWNSDAFGTS